MALQQHYTKPQKLCMKFHSVASSTAKRSAAHLQSQPCQGGVAQQQLLPKPDQRCPHHSPHLPSYLATQDGFLLSQVLAWAL